MATATRERPMVFRDWEVRAILEGRKTQTRWVVKLTDGRACPAGLAKLRGNVVTPLGDDGLMWTPYGGSPLVPMPPDEVARRCPRGSIGEHLWVREAYCHQVCDKTGRTLQAHYWYRATDGEIEARDDGFRRYRKDGSEASPWRSGALMPKEASRITLEITDVRVERLQAITEADAIAEGCEPISSVGPMRACGWRDYSGGMGYFDPRESFRSLWDHINGKRHPWSSDPWVWALTFKRV